ncbi:MAG: hypothetical protein QG657_823 [Acidobacteriota bacterium]|nr:hypothetical protein [Acidobacteriota bacterium]
MNGQTNDTLNVLFQEIGSHLRASDDIREGIANTFFTMVLGAITGLVILRLNGQALSSSTVRISILLGSGLIAFGEVVLWGVIAIRKWHAEYVNSMILVQAMITNKSFTPVAEIVPKELRYSYAPGLSTSRTYLLVQIGIACLFFGVADIVGEIIGDLCLSYFITLILSALIFFLNRYTAKKALSSAEKKFWDNPASSWCFAGFMIKKTVN